MRLKEPWGTFKMKNRAPKNSLRRSKSSFSSKLNETTALYQCPPKYVSHGSTTKFYWLKFTYMVANTTFYQPHFEFSPLIQLLLRNHSPKCVWWSWFRLRPFAGIDLCECVGRVAASSWMRLSWASPDTRNCSHFVMPSNIIPLAVIQTGISM